MHAGRDFFCKPSLLAHCTITCTVPVVLYLSRGLQKVNMKLSHKPFTVDESCLVGVPDGISGGGGAGGLLVLASVCCFITCLCCIFSISGFSMIELAKLDLLLLMLTP